MSTRSSGTTYNLGSLGGVLLREIEQLSREKGLSQQALIECLERAFQKVACDVYGHNRDIRVSIHRGDGSVSVKRCLSVVETVVNPDRELAIESAVNSSLGDVIEESLPFPDLNRVTVQDLKHEFVRHIQTLERHIQYQEFKDRVGHIISGVVKQVDHGNILVDIGRAEAIMSRHEMIPREQYRMGDRVKAYIYSVKPESRGPQILLSRTHPGFLVRLFAKEVPEIYDGLIEIKAAARDPGSRAKIAIIARDNQRSFDAVGACVGVRGNRVNAVSQELHGEKIDIVPWSSDPAVFVVNAMTPAEVSKVVIEKNNHIRVVVPDHQLSIAIGRRGQNVKLAHQLTGMIIEVIGEAQHTQQRVEWRDNTTRMFMDRLDLDELMAHFLVSEGFETLQELAQTPLAELAVMQGMNEDIASELLERAREAVAEEEENMIQQYVEAGGNQQWLELGLPIAILPLLIAHKIWTRQNFADLALDELMDIIKPHRDLLTEEQWGQLILKARAL